MKDFSKKEAIAWQKFLSSEAGIKGLLYLNSLCPGVARSPNSHEMHFDAGKVQGFKDCISAIDQIPDIRTDTEMETGPDSLER